MALKRDRALIAELLTRAEAFEREGWGDATPAALRKAAVRLEELSERKRYACSLMPQSAKPRPTDGRT